MKGISASISLHSFRQLDERVPGHQSIRDQQLIEVNNLLFASISEDGTKLTSHR